MKDKRPRFYTSEHAKLFLGDLYQQARNDFSVFRRMIRSSMRWGWWTDETARELQQFRADLIAGKRPILAFPPRRSTENPRSHPTLPPGLRATIPI
jgi:hypothetical protein